MIWIGTFLFLLTPLVSPILDILVPLNTPRPKLSLFVAESFLDEQKYFYAIYLISIFFTMITVFIIGAFDCLIAGLAQHCEGLIKILQ